MKEILTAYYKTECLISKRGFITLGPAVEVNSCQRKCFSLLPHLREIPWLNVLNLFAGLSSSAYSLFTGVLWVLDLSLFFFFSLNLQSLDDLVQSHSFKISLC